MELKLRDKDFWIKKLKGNVENKWQDNERLYLYQFVTNILETIIRHKNDMVCINEFGNVNLLDTFDKSEPLGTSGNLYSDNYKLTMQLDDYDIDIAVKVVPIDHKERLHMYDTRFPVWRELKSLEMVTNLVKQRIIPNLPILYGHYICNNCSYQNPQIINKEYKMCLLLLNELADTDLRSWIIKYSKETVSNQDRNTTWTNIFFQIWVVLYAVQSHYQMVHHDLHWGNLLINYIKSGGHWIYIIEGIKYYIPNVGIMLKLWDFGKCFSVTNFRYHAEEIEFQNYSSVHKHDISFGADISKIHNINRWIKDISEITNKGVMPAHIEKMIQKIRQKGDNTPNVLLKKYMRPFMHNLIGCVCKTVGADYQSITDVTIGDLVAYNNKYALITKIDIFNVILLIETDESDEESVLFSKIQKLEQQPVQDMSGTFGYLNEKCHGTYKI